MNFWSAGSEGRERKSYGVGESPSAFWLAPLPLALAPPELWLLSEALASQRPGSLHDTPSPCSCADSVPCDSGALIPTRKRNFLWSEGPRARWALPQEGSLPIAIGGARTPIVLRPQSPSHLGLGLLP